MTPEALARESIDRKLAQAGWQHPETFTWTEQMTGAFDFKAKRKILVADYMKFGKTSFSVIAPVEVADSLVTELGHGADRLVVSGSDVRLWAWLSGRGTPDWVTGADGFQPTLLG